MDGLRQRILEFVGGRQAQNINDVELVEVRAMRRRAVPANDNPIHQRDDQPDEDKRLQAQNEIDRLATVEEFLGYYRREINERFRNIRQAQGAQGQLQWTRNWAEEMRRYQTGTRTQETLHAAAIDTHRVICLYFIRTICETRDLALVRSFLDRQSLWKLLQTILIMNKANAFFVMRRNQPDRNSIGLLWYSQSQRDVLRRHREWRAVLAVYEGEGQIAPISGRVVWLVTTPALDLTDLQCWIRPEIAPGWEEALPTLDRVLSYCLRYAGVLVLLIWLLMLLVVLPLLPLNKIDSHLRESFDEKLIWIKNILLFFPLWNGLKEFEALNSNAVPIFHWTGLIVIPTVLSALLLHFLLDGENEGDAGERFQQQRSLVLSFFHLAGISYAIHRTKFLLVDPSCFLLFLVDFLDSAKLVYPKLPLPKSLKLVDDEPVKWFGSWLFAVTVTGRAASDLVGFDWSFLPVVRMGLAMLVVVGADLFPDEYPVLVASVVFVGLLVWTARYVLRGLLLELWDWKKFPTPTV